MVKIDKYKCKICGDYLYRTDSGGPLVTLQCSSETAMFWNYNRGTKEQHDSHEHFVNSTICVEKKEWDDENKKVQRV